MAEKTLTTKQRRFISEYLKDQNGAQAAKRSGYSKKAAKEAAYVLLTNAHIKKEIDARLAAIAEKAEVTTEYVLRGLKTVADRCLQEVDPIMDAWHQIKKDRNTGRPIFQFDSSGATKSLELLGKTKGMFIDKHDLTVGGRLVILRARREKE